LPVANGFSIAVQGDNIKIVKDIVKSNDGNLPSSQPTSMQYSKSNSNENSNPSILINKIEERKEAKTEEHKKTPLQIQIPVDIKDKSPKNSGACCGMKEVCHIF